MSSYQYGLQPNHSIFSHLSRKHRKILYEESGIDPGVAERAGVYSVRRGKDVPQESGWLPSRPGIAFPTPTLGNPDEAFTRMRYDAPGKGPKYRQPAGVANRLYVHPDQHEQIMKPGRARFVVEGEKKTLAGVSRGLLVVGLSGVWNGQKNKALIPDWDLLPLDGEIYVICFDSDITDNPNVADAADRQARLLQERGATVYMTVLPHAPDGSKQGLDDFFVNGGTIKELRMLTRKYEPGIFGSIRLSRDEKLAAILDELRASWWGEDWNRFTGAGEKPHWARGYSAREVEEALLRLAARSGKVKQDGVKVRAGVRAIADESGRSKRGVMKALRHLEAAGRIKIHEPENRKEARSYTLLKPAQSVTSSENRATTERQVTSKLQVVPFSGDGLRAPDVPRLRWSSPPRIPKLEKHREKYGDTVRVVTEVVGIERPYVARLGPHRGAVLDALEVSGGKLLVEDLCAVLKRKRPRDVKRRLLPMLEEWRIITVDGETVTLTADWRKRLDECREAKGEIQASDLQKARHKEESRQFREAGKTPQAGLEAVKKTKKLRERRLRERREEAERDRLASICPPSPVEVLVKKLLSQHERIRMGLLCEIVGEEGLRGRDVPPVVRRMGYRVERDPYFGNSEFVYSDKSEAA